MTEKLYYWAENLQNYSCDNESLDNHIIEIKRLNFFIGKNNAGKSRFLRNLFSTNLPFEDLNFITCSKELKSLRDTVNLLHPSRINIGNTHGSHFHGQLLSSINQIIQTPLFPRKNYKSIFYANFKKIREYCYTADPELLSSHIKIIQNLIDSFDEIYGFRKKFYIPILRGMRPVTNQENKQPYIERAQKDYFQDTTKFNSKNIITGECLYHELKIHLLGEPEQRELIKSYEEKLSQYFFDNQAISLIPKHDQDVVNIKIGNDKQFPVSELGDGLQQAIILTYEAFIHRRETYAFFVEEPELHMHAGMVRQLMNFYLNETKHYYFFTTHSNHLLDMADESDQVIIQKFIKQPSKKDPTKFDFKIYRCDRDRDLLASLGVRPSSVYLANCTIWVEGITDRLYITKYMEKYLAYLEKNNEVLYKKYRRFMPNYHYTFVEYAGSNLTHWSFSDEYANQLDDKGLSAKAVASDMLLIADGDIQDKADRVKNLIEELTKENFFKFSCKEIENTLPKDSIIRVAKSSFDRKHKSTKLGFTIKNLNIISDPNYFDSSEWGIGKLLDNQIRNTRTSESRTVFADGEGVGTIKYKTDFCREIIKDFDEHPDWELTLKAKELCERIFKHVEKCNK